MKIWIIGTGVMGLEYARVLQALKKDFIVIGRGGEKCANFAEKSGVRPVTGGLEVYLKDRPDVPQYVINAAGVSQLSATTLALLNYGCKRILLEKPGVGYPEEIVPLTEAVSANDATVVLAYNRRFYQATLAARRIIEEDGGVTSFNFEFTEWVHQIERIRDLKSEVELQNWFLGNSTHVVDLAFYLGGFPSEFKSFVSGGNEIDWHSRSSIFCGAGVSRKGALFSYNSNWKSPGRFSVEILTRKSRLIFRPLEKLQIQLIGSVSINPADGIDYTLDEKFKPGLYLQTKSFLEDRIADFCTIEEQRTNINQYYRKMAGYEILL